MGMIRRTAIVAAAGAATMYFLDPERGRARRAKARNRVERLTSTRAPVSTSYNDPTLAQKGRQRAVRRPRHPERSRRDQLGVRGHHAAG
jgi:hypothetical protein